ncbi:Bromodomain-containing factor 1 [Babesia sp. Xinjiang]|uniref:Bromodomain-containing factor 1 n=1 Tax=Babesia sp. Xinjiang TaxID=462227 RepID=UPI000A248627|nr:Bromodomain-containing factor 1 [Babesia sp. Xinjiang]ORM39623.1 Bromodomain-containing factor 1 [Babesia sp. Xinjiang]
MEEETEVKSEPLVDTPVAADENATGVATPTLMPATTLNSSDCRGELILEPEEADHINDVLSQTDFRFVIYVNEQESAKPPKKSRPDPALWAAGLIDGATSPYEARHRRSYSSLRSRDSAEDDALTLSSFDASEKRSLRKRKQRVRYYDEFAEDFAESNYREVRHERSHKSHKEALRKHSSGSYEKRQLYRSVPVLSRNLPKLPKDTWEYTAYRTLQSIKYMDSEKWFWYPVDPIADGVPNYNRIVKTPMDFHTITERLHMREYSNPFAFQCDVRQIFFNAFLFYPKDNRIWQAAEHLSRIYEEKLSTIRYLNPEEFHALLNKGEDAMRAILLEYNETTFNRKSKWPTNAQSSTDVDLSKPLEKRKAAQHNRHKHIIDQFMYNDDDDDSFNELSSVASADEFMMPLESMRGRPRSSKKKGSNGRMYYIQRRPRAGETSENSDSDSRLRFMGEVVIPEVGFVPPPPPPTLPALQKVGAMERGLTPAQTRTLDINLSRLAPNQRKAALELVEDDLGILAEVFMNDTTFTFDPSLLSVDKQRRIFIYINQMVKRNIEDMQAAYERNRKSRPSKPGTARDTTEPNKANPSQMFDASSSSSSTISDVASNFLSSDDFFDSSDDERGNVSQSPEQPPANDTPLPEYTPVDELKPEKVQLTRGIMGDHVDFLAHVESPPLTEDGSAGQQSKKSAWTEWKGQAIHHGTVAQQNGVKPRSVDEKIAESFDARI